MVIRWLKFNTVGALGAVVQLGSLWLWNRLGVHYLIATALAVELAVLHNYVWHIHWTWADRPDRFSWRSLVRFHLGNGLVSLCSNLVLMRIFTGVLGFPVLLANLAAITITSLVNYFVGDRWVFSTSPVRHDSSII